RKLERNVMDYDDLLLNVKKLLVEKREIAEIYAEQFQHILVDEYQDTNKLQAEIIDLLAVKHRNVMVVGDDAQSIYAWRGAEFTNIYEFPQRYPEARVFRLETNYRSTPEILALANVSIASNRKQFPKTLRPARNSQGLPLALVRRADFQAAPRRGQGWADFLSLLESLVQDETRGNPSRQIELILTRGYELYLANNYENAEARLEDLRQLALYSARYNSTE